MRNVSGSLRGGRTSVRYFINNALYHSRVLCAASILCAAALFAPIMAYRAYIDATPFRQ